MKVTFAEVPDSPPLFEEFWKALISHTRSHPTNVVVLNEFCFIPWFCKQHVSSLNTLFH